MKGIVFAVLTALFAAIPPWLMATEPKKSDPDQVVTAAVAALVTTLVGVGLGWRRPAEDKAVVLPGLAAVAASITALVSIGLAVGAERQNYWDAFHFAALFWCGALCGIAGLTSFIKTRATSPIASNLLPPAAAVVVAYLVLWSWMTFSFVQDIEGAVLRWSWLLTHG